MKPPYALGIFLVALAIRIVHTWQLRKSPFFDVLLGDARGYDEWARRIAGGEWIGRDVFYQAPLYPYFLGTIYAIAGHSLVAVRVVQALVGAASCALLGLAGSRFFSPTAGSVAGLALAVYAPAIFFDGLLQKSVLDVFFLSLGLWLIGRLLDAPTNRRLWLSLGLAMGALSLTRENALVFIVVILAWCLVRLPETAFPQVRLKPDPPTAQGRLKTDPTTGTVRLKPDATTATGRLTTDPTTGTSAAAVRLKPDPTSARGKLAAAGVGSGFSRNDKKAAGVTALPRKHTKGPALAGPFSQV